MGKNDNLMIDWGESLVNDFCNQEVEKRIKERMPTEEEDDRLAMEYADSTGRKSSTCHNVIYRAYRRALEDCRSRLTCSEKPNNSEQQMWRDIQEREREQ